MINRTKLIVTNLARTWLILLVIIVAAGASIVAHAEGSRQLVANGGKRALTEWRTNTTAGLYRRTFFRVYAKSGESILMASSAMGVGSGNIVVYRENQITSSQIAPTALSAITPTFRCSTGGTGGGRGMLNTRTKELAGPTPASGGYVPCTYTAPATETYWVAMYGPDGASSANDGTAGTIASPDVSTAQRSGVSMWDITVRSAAGVNIPGRVFVDYLAQISGGNGSSYRVFSTMYAVTVDGFIYQVDFNGMDPNGYIFYGNRVGFLDPDGKTPLYHDLVTNNNQLTSPFGGVLLAPAAAKMFFSYPAADLPASILPTPVAPSISSIGFVGSKSGSTAYYSMGGQFTYTGNIGGINEIIISQDGIDFSPNTATNRVIRVQSYAGANSVAWDGKDNAGNYFPVNIPVGTNYAYRMNFHAGEYHFPMLDVENSQLGGPVITLKNPLNGVCPLATCRHAFYDDRGYKTSTGVTVGTVGATLPGDSNSLTPPTINSDIVDGFDTATTQRAFGNGTGSGFGNWKGLDLWTYFPVAPVNGSLNIEAQGIGDLRIVKSHSGLFEVASPGGSFSLVVTNVGSAAISGAVTINDTLPAGLTPVSASGSGWNTCTISGQDVSCTHPNTSGLAAGASLPAITLTVNVAPAAAPSVANTATLTNANDTNADNNSSTDTVTINTADIELTKIVVPDNPAEGDTVTFTITARNTGPGDATGLQVTDLLPGGLTYVSDDPSQGTYTPAAGLWDIGSLPNQAFATLSLAATVNAGKAGSTITNQASITAAGLYDPVSSNDSASAAVTVQPTVLTGVITDEATGTPIKGATVTVTDANSQVYVVTTDNNGRYTVTGLAAGSASIAVTAAGYNPGSATKTVVSGIVNTQDVQLQNADLLLMKDDGTTTTTAGSTLVYTIRITNHGSATAENIVVDDKLSAGLSYVSNDSGYAPTDLGGGQYRWNFPSSITIAPGASYTFHVTAAVADPLPVGAVSVSNYATVSTSTPESNLTDNEQSDIDQVLQRPDLTVTITDGQTQATAGQSLVYNLAYANIGNTVATSVVVQATYPAGLTITPSSDYVIDTGNRTITWTTIPSVAASAGGSLSFTATVDAGTAPGSVLSVTATIVDDGTHGAELDTSNNTFTDSDVVVRPDIVLEKSTAGPAVVGQELTYTIRYSNPSSVTATSVTVNDTLPTGASYVAGSCSPACTFAGGNLSWTIGDVAPNTSGSVSYRVTLDATAGGGSLSTPGLTTEPGGGSLEVVSDVGAADLKVRFTDADPVGPSGWQANPWTTAFDDSTWDPSVAAFFESYWLPASALSAEWVAQNPDDQLDPNYTFFRQSTCLPLNAADLSAGLQLAGDDVSDIYLNGVLLGQHIGGGSASTFNGNSALQPGPNLLAVRLLNNRHGGHAGLGGYDHAGLLYNLDIAWGSLRPFASANLVVKAGQTVSFAADPLALGGRAPFEYRFEFGEGTPQDYSTTATAAHTYNTAGTYSAVVRARDAAGCTAADPLTITVLPADSSLVLNTAQAAYTGPTGGSYTASSGTALDLPLAELQIAKTSTPKPAVSGETLTYHLTVTNNGPRTIYSLTLVDVLPEALTGPTYTPSAGSYDPATGSWTGVTLASGGSLTLDIAGVLDPYFSGTLNNTAQITAADASTGPASDTVTANNTANDTNTPTPAEIGVTISTTPYYTPEGQVTYNLSIVNNGTETLSAISLADVLPPQVLNLIYTPGVGSYDPDTNTWSGLSFAPGNTIQMTVVGTVESGFTELLTYSVEVNPIGKADILRSNNTASADKTYSPTAVTVSLFEALWQGARGVVLHWQTVADLWLPGFQIYRREGIAQSWQLLTAELIAAQVPETVASADYTWIDATAQGGKSYEYCLRPVGAPGGEGDCLTATVSTARSSYLLFLPMVADR